MLLEERGGQGRVALVSIERFFGGDLGRATEPAFDHRLEVARGHAEAAEVFADGEAIEPLQLLVKRARRERVREHEARARHPVDPGKPFVQSATVSRSGWTIPRPSAGTC